MEFLISINKIHELVRSVSGYCIFVSIVYLLLLSSNTKTHYAPTLSKITPTVPSMLR
jgi:hypothetical protein